MFIYLGEHKLQNTSHVSRGMINLDKNQIGFKLIFGKAAFSFRICEQIQSENEHNCAMVTC
jgi:hypothetical protein